MDPARGPNASPDRGLVLDLRAVPTADPAVEPSGFLVAADDGTRIHFLDWGREASDARETEGRRGRPQDVGVVMVAGVGETAWTWTPVARRLQSIAHVVAMDLRGHGLSDAPLDGYEPSTLAADVVAVADAAGLLEPEDLGALVFAGHGFGAAVATLAAGSLGGRGGGLVLVDGGWETLAETTDLAPDELLRSLDEPPEVLGSMAAWLADRAAFDPPTWDRDQERAARETVVELPSGRLVPAIQPHVRAALVDAMFAYEPLAALRTVRGPIVALLAGEGDEGGRSASLERTAREVVALGGPAIRAARYPEGHNLMRYRPAEVAAAILHVAERGRLGHAIGKGDGRR